MGEIVKDLQDAIADTLKALRDAELDGGASSFARGVKKLSVRHKKRFL